MAASWSRSVPPMVKSREAKPILEAVLERNDWEPVDLSSTARVPIDTLRKWLAGTSNPTEQRLAEVLTRAGTDPTEFGLRPPKGMLDDATAQRLERMEALLEEILTHVRPTPAP